MILSDLERHLTCLALLPQDHTKSVMYENGFYNEGYPHLEAHSGQWNYIPFDALEAYVAKLVEDISLDEDAETNFDEWVKKAESQKDEIEPSVINVKYLKESDCCYVFYNNVNHTEKVSELKPGFFYRSE